MIVRIGDARTRNVYERGFTEGIPVVVCRLGRRKLGILVATHSWSDVSVVGEVGTWRNLPGRFGIRVHGKWFLIFQWLDGYGPHDIVIKRR